MGGIPSKEQIYTDYKDKVFAYIRNHVNSPEDAEDLCADVFVKVYDKLDTFDESKARISTWIYSITSNTVIDFYRTNHIHSEIPEDLSDTKSSIEEEVLTQESLSELATALLKLTEEQRDIIVLRYYKGLTLQEVSQKMNLSYGITKLRHREALGKLQDILA
ncbi:MULTISPECIES: RNA polymerase sigma factor [unclassified Butyrivibrio]|jgi:RNA polymerase sigma-70 factor (ECF subfamily)|uniref:RNA polymerase sigma factor n=1 Tax=unclassified Butyrivibrio TaxID=2639466 RepID=UPI0003B2F652|nr:MULTISPECIES: sigma-70 family RNA polymerase sigma factor [unclassified Butyrivibrio]MBE5838539.1 sigma-70 family RNA polymerase sigma factor [Butyrivibrio sp.]MBP3817536.1 sigma-70 family RNA polymerase sigma factor [Butyrivibrio sp.]MBQ7431238.1 sigma-70 family RNA polymerase sigma factor [Butyrivibrio sp.]MBQ9305398.1 sigma-70 family RNA polymerase sigma factor [Butyrivibrio sp.]